MNTLPIELYSKIMLYVSHPIADLFKQSGTFDEQPFREHGFKIWNLKRTSKKRSPFASGWKDALNGFPCLPNIIGDNLPNIYTFDLTPE